MGEERRRALRSAIERRAALFDEEDCDACRLFHGFGESQDRASIDRYGPAVLIKTFEIKTLEDEPGAFIEDALAALDGFVPGLAAVVHKDLRRGAGRAAGEGRVIAGALPEALVVREAGLRFAVELVGARNTGLFLDARPIRARLRGLAEGRRVLNLFSYTASFAVAALKGGAASVVNVDINRQVHERAAVNYRLNGLEPDPRDFITAPAEKALRHFLRRGQSFDALVFDPPRAAGARRSNRGFRARRDYGKLLARALALLAPGGFCLALSTDLSLLHDGLEALIRESAAAAGLAIAELRELVRGADFPGGGVDPRLKGYLVLRGSGGVSSL